VIIHAGDTKRNYSGIEACDVPHDRADSLSSAQVGAYLEGSRASGGGGGPWTRLNVYIGDR
jgi:hypothetical protein